MSYGAGHIQDMINRVKQNAALKNARRNKFKGGNDYSNIKNKKTEYNIPKPTRYKLSELKRKIRKQAKKEQESKIILWIFTIILPLIIGFAIFLLY